MSIQASVDKYVKLNEDNAELSSNEHELNRQLDHLERQKQVLLDEKREIEEKKEKELLGRIQEANALIAEMVEKDKIPSHERISEIYKLCKNNEAVETCINFTHRAFESLDPANENFDISNPNTVKFIENISDVNTTEGEPGKPQIFVKRIQQEQRNWLGGRYRPRRFQDTDEVMVIVKLNNDPDQDPSKTTIIEAVVKTTKTSDGKELLMMRPESPGIYDMKSQAEFTEGWYSDNPSYEAKMERGDMTIEEYLSNYKKDHKESLYDYHDKKDKKLERDPNYINSKQEREDFIESIPDRYTELLEATQEFKQIVIDQLEDFLYKQLESFEKAMNDPPFRAIATELLELVKEDDEREGRGEERINDPRIKTLRDSAIYLYPDVPLNMLNDLFGRS